MNDAVVISDLHLGSDNCQAHELVEFLERVHSGELPAKRLILNGDVFDSIDFRRLKKSHWKVLSLLRKLADRIEIVWIAGNHDGSAEIVSHLLGVEVRDELVIDSGDRRVLFLHGHRFDDFIETFPLTSWFADRVYRLLQRLDRSHTFAKRAKRTSKFFLRCVEKVEQRAIVHATQHGFDVVCCGHTHQPAAIATDRVEYFNSGSWSEKPCHYLAVRAGRVTVHEFAPAPAEAHAGLELAAA